MSLKCSSCGKRNLELADLYCTIAEIGASSLCSGHLDDLVCAECFDNLPTTITFQIKMIRKTRNTYRKTIDELSNRLIKWLRKKTKDDRIELL